MSRAIWGKEQAGVWLTPDQAERLAKAPPVSELPRERADRGDVLRASCVSQPGAVLDLAGKGKEEAKYRRDAGYLGLRKGTQGRQAGGGASFSAEGPTAGTPSRKGSQIHKGSHEKTR